MNNGVLLAARDEARIGSLESMESLASVDEIHWYAVRTRSRHEKIATQQLESRGLETFLPLVNQVRQWSDRKKEVELPLFSGYCFVRLNYSSSERRLGVLQTHGVVSFVGVQRTGVPIPDSQIEDLRTLLNNKIPMKERTFLQVGQRVRVRGGALDGVEGILTSQSGERSLVLSIESIQRSLSIRVEGYDVEPV
jgi:transcription antitermination factor NusG